MRRCLWGDHSFCSVSLFQARSRFRSRLARRPVFWGTFCVAPSSRPRARSSGCSYHSWLSCRRDAFPPRLPRTF